MAKKKAARKTRRKATKDLTAWSRKARDAKGGATLWNGSDKPPTSKP
jgi:hypothetical protein